MGRIRQYKLTWKPSKSNHVVGYRLYWSYQLPIGYNADYYKLGNVTEANLSDLLQNTTPSQAPIYVGVSAVDAAGNESDIISLPESYYLKAPAAPTDLALKAVEDPGEQELIKPEDQSQANQAQNPQQSGIPARQEFLRPNKKLITTEGRITDDFGKFLSESLKS